jgi:glycosyltransferase involved in cell wall biosynthesis
VEFVKHFIPYSLLPNLYNSADAFVLASHGEGWGLPLMEAMAMKKPAIGTNWGGNLAFMNSRNSFLVDVEKMEKAPKPNVRTSL